MNEKEIRKKIKDLDDKRSSIENKIRNTEEFKRLEKEHNSLTEKERRTNDKIKEISKNIKLKYLENNAYSTIYKGSWDSNRNIRQETIKAIKKVLGITNISVLNSSEVEEAVDKLIENSKDKNKELQILEKKSIQLRNKINEFYENQQKLLEKTDKELDKRHALYQKLNKISERDRWEKEENKKKVIRWNKENETRKKMKNLVYNFEEIDIALNKEMILSNLEDE